MADDGISTKVSVLGDKEYKKALSDIGRQLTVLNTEMSATASAFGDQADSMEALQAKADGLHKVYDVQAEKVRLVAEQLNKAKGEYEENSKQVQDLQIALNRARAAMNKTGSEIQKNDRAMESLADSTAKAATEEKAADSAADKLKKTLGDSAAKCAAYDQQLRDVERSLKRSSDQSAGLAEKQELLQRKYETQGQACDELASAYRKSVQESGEFSAESVALSKKLQDQKDALYKTADELEKNAKAMEEAGRKSSTMTTGTDKAEKAIKEEADAAKKAEKETSGLGDAMKDAGNDSEGLNMRLIAAAGAIAALSAAALAGAKAALQLGTDYAQATNQLSAQTGATGEELTALGEIAQRVYANNFGENIADVNDALATTKVNTGLMGDELQKATENGFMLRDVFGMDFTESTRAASSLMQKFGISADEAYNLIALGAQRGANQNGDMLDVISEYAPKYAEMGLSAQDMFSTLIAGAEGGVFQIDKVGDAVKEFSIRAIDGSDQTKEAFEALGLKASYVSAEIAEGGPQARNAFLEVVSALEQVEDPVERNRLAVALFGTQFEDLGSAALPILSSIADGGDLSADALAQINAVKYDDAATALEGVRRKIEAEFLPLADNLHTMATDALNQINTAFADGIQPEDMRAIGESVANMLMEGILSLPGLIKNGIPTLIEAGGELLAGIASGITQALTESGWTQKGQEIIDGLAQGITNAVQTAVDAIKGVWSKIWSAFCDIAGIHSPSTVAAEAGDFILQGLVEGFQAAVDGVITTVKAIFGRIWDAIKSIFGFGSESEESKEAKTAGQDIMTGMKDGITGSEDTVKTAVKTAAANVLATLKTELGIADGSSTETKAMGTSVAKGISDGLGAATADTFKTGASTLATAVADAINAAFGVEGTGFAGLGEKSAKAFEAIGASICKAVADGITGNTQNTEAVKTAITGVANAAYTTAVAEMATGITGGSETVNAAVDAVATDALDAAAAILTTDAGGKIGKDFMDGIKQAVQTARPNLVNITTQTAKAAHDAAKREMSQSKGQTIGTALAQGIRAGITGQQSYVTSAAQSLGSGALSALWGAVGSGGSRFEGIGSAIAQGVARGIRNGSGTITSAARAAAQAAYNAAKRELDIRSPSHKMEAIGLQYDQGFAGGIEKGMEGVMRSARQLSALAAEETAAGGRAYPSMTQPQIDYEQLGEAVADANRRAGLGHARLYVGKRQLGETIEPDVSRATYQRANKSATGRAARMVLA